MAGKEGAPGLFYPDGQFRSEREIKRDLALKGQLPPIIEGAPERKTLKDYIGIAIKRSKDAREFSPQAQGNVIVRVPDDAIINFIADVHAFHPTTNHERLFQEVETIMETPRSYIVFGGDLIEGIHWGGASGTEMVGSLDEQKGFMRELWRRTKGRVVGAVSGEHDSKWAARSGSDPYCDFTDITGAPYKRGLLEMYLEAGGEEYTGIIAHKLRGDSIYSNTHPAVRASREIQGHDFYFGAHTHRKGLTQQAVREVEGARMVTYGISGPYKQEDEFTQRSGWLSQKSRQLYGFAVRFNPDEKRIEVDEDIVHANKRWG